MKTNIVLIGMPGVGKSTLGVLLAKALSVAFLDTDVFIQAKEGKRLQEIIDSFGLDHFCRLEQEHLLSLVVTQTVIATGGSAVYSEKAMQHLKANGIMIHLDLPLNEIKTRITDLTTRGVVMEPDQTLDCLYEKRNPLYKQWSEITIDCSGKSHQTVLKTLIEKLSAVTKGSIYET